MIAHTVHVRAEVDVTYWHSKDGLIHQKEGLSHFKNRSLAQLQIISSSDIHISLSQGLLPHPSKEKCESLNEDLQP